MNSSEFRDPVFKGCTRPAMKFGVPLVPLIVVCGVIAVVANATTIILNLIMVPVVLVMAQVTTTDDQKWRLIWLRMRFRLVYIDRNRRFWSTSTYAPLAFRRR